MEYEILKISENPKLIEQASEWFHQKWSIDKNAYLQSMKDALSSKTFPEWYVVMSKDKIIAGMGVLENDFHNRKDLSPNVCAVFVEPQYRGNGIAGKLLQFVCDDFKAKGFDKLYLLTDHTSFYERYGWEFLCKARGDGEDKDSRIYVHKTKKRQNKTK